MLFLIYHVRVLLQNEAMDAVVARFFLVVRVDTAARDNHHVRTLAHIEIIIDKIVDVAVGDAGRDVYPLPLGVGLDVDHQTGRVLLRLYLDILRGLTSCTFTVFTDIKRAVEFAAEIRDHAQEFVCNRVHTAAISFPSGQRTAFSSASSAGRTRSRGPKSRTMPPAITRISSAIDSSRS